VTDIAVCDVRWYLDGRDSRAAYRAGHIPGAVFVDLDDVLAGPPAPIAGRHPLPDPDSFARSMGALGIGDDTTVVAYDDQGGMVAGRLVWMLRVLDQPAALLDGGLAAWDRPLATDLSNREPATRRPQPWPPAAIVDADAVADHAEAGGVVVDSRATPRYRGDEEPVDPRAGHIPGALSLPFAAALHDGRFRHRDDLRRHYRAAGVGGGARGGFGGRGGPRACVNVLAIEAAGLGRPRLYVGSWSGWSSDPARPAATGDQS
jgi:thiosulfate/3-mercaptopyruvate sulfurtransferase